MWASHNQASISELMVACHANTPVVHPRLTVLGLFSIQADLPRRAGELNLR